MGSTQSLRGFLILLALFNAVIPLFFAWYIEMTMQPKDMTCINIVQAVDCFRLYHIYLISLFVVSIITSFAFVSLVCEMKNTTKELRTNE